MDDDLVASVMQYPPTARDACPSCGHTPTTVSRCFGTDIACLNWRGEKVPCLCVADAHFGARVGGYS